MRNASGLGDLLRPNHRDAVTRAVAAPKSFNLGMNQGEVAGVAAHSSINTLFPAGWGDANFLPIISSDEAVPELLEDARARLAAAWPRRTDARKSRTFYHANLYHRSRVFSRLRPRVTNMVTVAGTVATVAADAA